MSDFTPRNYRSVGAAREPNGRLDREKILGGALGGSDNEFLRYAKEKYGRASSYEKGSSQRYRELMYGGYKPIEALRVFKEFVGYLRPYRKYLVLAVFGFLVSAILLSARVAFVKYVIDVVLPSGNYHLLWAVCVALVGTMVLRSAFTLLCQYLVVYIGGFVVFDVRQRLFDHLQLLHIGFYEREMSGKLITRLIHDVTALSRLIESGLNVLVLAICSILINVTWMIFLSWRMTLWSFLIIPAYWAVTQYYKNRFYRKSMEVRERQSILTGNVTEVVLGAKVVKSFGMEDEERKRFTEMLLDNLVPEIELGTYNIHRGALLDLITGVSLSIVFLFGGLSIIRGGDNAISMGTFVAFASFMMMLFHSLLEVAGLRLTVISAQTGLERVLAVLEVDPEIKEPAKPLRFDIRGRVEFRDVRFAYVEGKEVLHGINLAVEPGQMIALVGPSGSGKSTMINLLTRFYDVKSGAIFIDGHDVRTLSLKNYRSQIGIVLQDPFLFSGTIEDNIRYGRPDATKDETLEAARQANVMEFIDDLPEGLETLVGERGGLLSGGQRQRISIARALLRRPKILILDEATSSLDNESERLVQEAMDRLMAGRTVFVIAHRLSTVQNSDKIVVMKGGNIVEEGTHEELLARDTLYRRLYRGAKIQLARRKRDQEGAAVPTALSSWEN